MDAAAAGVWQQHPKILGTSRAMESEDEKAYLLGKVLQEHDPVLHLASLLLPRNLRHAVWALYAWCRRAADVVNDQGSVEWRAARLAAIEADFDRLMAGEPTNAIDRGVWRTMCLYRGLGPRPFKDWLASMRSELERSQRIADYDELWFRSCNVASAMGLMLLPVLGVSEPTQQQEQQAIDLGVAVRLTKILRDVGRDATVLDRIYLPKEELESFGVSEEDVVARRLTIEYQQLMAMQVYRAHELLHSARLGAVSLPPPVRLAALVVVEQLTALLQKLEARRYDNLTGTVELGMLRKFQALSTAFWKGLVLVR